MDSFGFYCISLIALISMVFVGEALKRPVLWNSRSMIVYTVAHTASEKITIRITGSFLRFAMPYPAISEAMMAKMKIRP